MSGKFSVSVRGVAVKDGKILLAKEREEGVWETPGGHIELGESVEDALRREFIEETGYEIKIKKPLYAFNRYDFVFIVYLVELGKKVKSSKLDAKTRWFSKDEVRKLLESKVADDHDMVAFKMFLSGEFDEKA